jgi:Family of unknown function (DUF5763)
MKSPICRGIRKDGERCKHRTRYEDGFCYAHSYQAYNFLNNTNKPVPYEQNTMKILRTRLTQYNNRVYPMSIWQRIASPFTTTKTQMMLDYINKLYPGPYTMEQELLDHIVAFIENHSEHVGLWQLFFETMYKKPATRFDVASNLNDVFMKYVEPTFLPLPSAPVYMDPS